MRIRNWVSPLFENIRPYFHPEIFLPFISLMITGLLVCSTPPFFIGLWPNLFLPFLYLWSLYYPERVPLPLIAVMGFLHDVYAGIPLGFHSFLYGILFLLVVTQRTIIIGRPFMVVWVGFGSFLVAISLIGIFIARLFESFPANSFDLQFHMVVTIGMLPLVYQVFQPLFRPFRSS